MFADFAMELTRKYADVICEWIGIENIDAIEAPMKTTIDGILKAEKDKSQKARAVLAMIEQGEK